ncbi:MAG: sugar ABC transporter substrate-binding protein [Solirubrobacteraceae bacterium]
MSVTKRANARRFKRLSAALAVAMLAAAAAGCGSDNGGAASSSDGGSAPVAQDETVRIGFFGLAAENAYTQFMYQAAEEEAAAVNAELEFFDGKFEGPAQTNQMQDAITSGQFDGFIVMPNDQTGIVPVVEQALAEGIEVAALQFPVGPDPTQAAPQVEGLTTSVIEDVVAGARITAEGINAMCEGRDPCKTGILWGSRKVTWDGPAKRPHLMESLDPNVEIVAEADGGFLQGPGQKATSDMLQAHPDLDVLATPSGDQMTLGGERALAAKNKQIGLADRPDDAVAIVGYGASKAGVERVRSGTWYQTYALVPQTMAREALSILVGAVRGQEVKSDGLVQTEISPAGDNITRDVLEEHPDFEAEWEG